MWSLGDPAQHRAATQLKWESTKENKFFPGASLTAIIITMPLCCHHLDASSYSYSSAFGKMQTIIIIGNLLMEASASKENTEEEPFLSHIQGPWVFTYHSSFSGTLNVCVYSRIFVSTSPLYIWAWWTSLSSAVALCVPFTERSTITWERIHTLLVLDCNLYLKTSWEQPLLTQCGGQNLRWPPMSFALA